MAFLLTFREAKSGKNRNKRRPRHYESFGFSFFSYADKMIFSQGVGKLTS